MKIYMVAIDVLAIMCAIALIAIIIFGIYTLIKNK